MSIFVDYVGLNTLISSSFDTDTNVLTSNLNSAVALAANPALTPLPVTERAVATNLHRNGPYSFATFKQIRIHENPLSRYNRINNILSFTELII